MDDTTVVVPRAARGRRSRLLRIAAALVALAAIASGVFYRPLFLGNLGVVDAGRVYRSAQPGDELPRRIAEYKLASVLNLRGGSPANPWYEAEVRAAREGGADYYDVPLAATRRPKRRQLLDLMDLLGRCKYPLLIHCKAGADRTGLVSGLYLMTRRGVPPEEAERAFTLSHLHVPIGGPERLHEPFVEYAGWLKSARLTHTPERFRDWVEREYRDESEEPVAASRSRKVTR